MSDGQSRQEASSATADHIRALERSRIEALVAADIHTAAELHAPDFQLITPRGRALTKGEYLDAVTSGQIRYLAWQPDCITVQLHGDVALIRYTAWLQLGSDDGAKSRIQCWHTDSYVKRDGRWQVVWSQATRIE